MSFQDALTLIQIGANFVNQLDPSQKTAATTAQILLLEELIAKQVQAYQEMAGKPIDEVLAKLTPVNPNPDAVDGSLEGDAGQPFTPAP